MTTARPARSVAPPPATYCDSCRHIVRLVQRTEQDTPHCPLCGRAPDARIHRLVIACAVVGFVWAVLRAVASRPAHQDD